MKVLYIRSNDISFDSRSQKELLAISKIPNLTIDILGWNRDGGNTKEVKEDIYQIGDKTFTRYLVEIFAPWGRGGKANMMPLFHFMKSIKKWVNNHIDEYDAIHVVDLVTAHYVIPIAKKHNKKVIYDIFDYFADMKRYPKLIRNYFVKDDNKLISKADVTIICTDERRKQLGNAKPNRLEIIHNSPDIKDILPKERQKGSPIRFCYVGNLTEERYISMLLEYFANHEQYIFDIGGIGNLEEKVKQHSKEHKNIIYHGKMKYDNVLELENNSDILFALYNENIPNHKYIAPNKFYEALALGKRLIAIKGTGLDNYFEQYDIGELIESNLDSLDNAINTLIQNQDKWYQLGLKERQLFDESFSWSIMEDRLIKIYKDILEIK